MKRIIFLSLLLSSSLFAQTSLDELRWYMNPNGQELIISIDDLHDELVTATSSMNWGANKVKDFKIKKEVRVAIIDGGIDIEHPDLKENILYSDKECYNGHIIPSMDEDHDENGYKGDCVGWDFVSNKNRVEDEDGHGTHVAGLIKSVIGEHNEVKFLPLKVFAPNEGLSSSGASATPLYKRLTDAFHYAIDKNVDLIHLSVGWPRSFLTHDLEKAIEKAISKGILVVAAAGNSSQRATIYPCQMKGVICVGALRADGSYARFSNWGTQVDILAPGEKILSTIPYNVVPLHISRRGYDYKNGTSQAAPFITGALALLRGHFTSETRDEVFARLMKGATPNVDGLSIKGLFQLDKSFELKNPSITLPELKGIHSIVVGVDRSFELPIEFKTYGKKLEKTLNVIASCVGVKLSQTKFKTDKINLSGKLQDDLEELNCSFEADSIVTNFKVKVLEKFDNPDISKVVSQAEPLVMRTRTGAASRFLTIQSLVGAIPRAYYYIQKPNEVLFYNGEEAKGKVPLKNGCTLLRMLQFKRFEKDESNGILVESICNKEFLRYQFLDANLSEIYPTVTYRPELAVINYDEFEFSLDSTGLPVFRFLNIGTVPASTDPWEDTSTTARAKHLYELRPSLIEGELEFKAFVLEEPKKWQKSLGLRHLSNLNVLQYVEGKLLVSINNKTAWVDVKTQEAVYANLDHLILFGSRKQSLINADGVVLQGLLTPYDYRGFVVSTGVVLRFIQDNRFDPIMDILGTSKTSFGHETVVRTFQHLIYLKFDESGVLFEKKEVLVDRFDFLTAQDLIATVIKLDFKGKMLQVIDGTKVNTNYVDVIIDSKKVSYEVPSMCVTQSPVEIDNKVYLPLFCAVDSKSFEMRFFSLIN